MLLLISYFIQYSGVYGVLCIYNHGAATAFRDILLQLAQPFLKVCIWS